MCWLPFGASGAVSFFWAGETAQMGTTHPLVQTQTSRRSADAHPKPPCRLGCRTNRRQKQDANSPYSTEGPNILCRVLPVFLYRCVSSCISFGYWLFAEYIYFFLSFLRSSLCIPSFCLYFLLPYFFLFFLSLLAFFACLLSLLPSLPFALPCRALLPFYLFVFALSVLSFFLPSLRPFFLPSFLPFFLSFFLSFLLSLSLTLPPSLPPSLDVPEGCPWCPI